VYDYRFSARSGGAPAVVAPPAAPPGRRLPATGLPVAVAAAALVALAGGLALRRRRDVTG